MYSSPWSERVRWALALVCLEYLLSIASAYAGPANRQFCKSSRRVKSISRKLVRCRVSDPSSTACRARGATPNQRLAGGGLFINEIRVRNNTAPGPVHIFAVDNMLRGGPQSSRDFDEGADLVVEGDYQTALAAAQFVGVLAPGAMAAMAQQTRDGRGLNC
jgi:hypothetical protein